MKKRLRLFRFCCSYGGEMHASINKRVFPCNSGAGVDSDAAGKLYVAVLTAQPQRIA
jgi:hypothetical protein